MNSISDMEKMQKEAVRKVREMHSKSKFLNDTEKILEPQTKTQQGVFSAKKQGNPMLSLSQILFQDTEKSLILILIILLMDSEDNLPMILALLATLI